MATSPLGALLGKSSAPASTQGLWALAQNGPIIYSSEGGESGSRPVGSQNFTLSRAAQEVTGRRESRGEREGWRLAHTETQAPAKRSLFWRSSSPSHRSACACVRVTLKPQPQKPRGQSDQCSSSTAVCPTSSALGRKAPGGSLSRSAGHGTPAAGRGQEETGAPTPTPRLGESIPLPSRDREPGFSITRAAGRRQGGSRHAATLPPFPGPPAPRRGPGAVDPALRQTFPGPRRLEEPAPSTYLRPSGSRALLGRRAGVGLRSPLPAPGAETRVPSPASPSSPLGSPARRVAPGTRRRRKEKWKLSTAPGPSPRPPGPPSPALLPARPSSPPACPRHPAPVTHLGAGAGWSGRARRRALPHVAPPTASWR
ncbi:translation initiation factor IF-2-like [Cebus imitator]|uniref:translation initiation factor IF-2-like n=1 Tax=Cebus imitator TaxID=2715852 RepID=UPI0018985428|nr:translation initiation factor IF-2-like [Cebus imitator]